jgi:hypothetical protein
MLCVGTATVHAQIVGEHSLGVMFGMPLGGRNFSPTGLTYSWVAGKNAMLEFTFGHDRLMGYRNYEVYGGMLDTKFQEYLERHQDADGKFLGKATVLEDKSPVFKRGGLVLGFAYQPFFHLGSRGFSVNGYANLGFRMRYHLNPGGFSMGKDGYSLTPEVIGGAGLLFEVSEFLEMFFDGGVKFFNEDGDLESIDRHPYELGFEARAGLRITINKL